MYSFFAKIYRNKSNIICIITSLQVYVLNKSIFISKADGVVRYFLRCYLNDLMAPFFFLAVSGLLLKWAGCEKINVLILIILGMFAGIVWEYFAPIINSDAISDPIDLLCYFFGTMGYWCVTRRIFKQKI